MCFIFKILPSKVNELERLPKFYLCASLPVGNSPFGFNLFQHIPGCIKKKGEEEEWAYEIKCID